MNPILVKHHSCDHYDDATSCHSTTTAVAIKSYRTLWYISYLLAVKTNGKSVYMNIVISLGKNKNDYDIGHMMIL